MKFDDYMPIFTIFFLSNIPTARPWEQWMFILWRQRLMVPRLADKGAGVLNIWLLTRISAHGANFKTKKGREGHQLVAEQ